MKPLLALLAIGLAAATPLPKPATVVSPYNDYNFNAESAARFCVDRVLAWKVRPSVADARRELNWCYNTLLPRA